MKKLAHAREYTASPALGRIQERDRQVTRGLNEIAALVDKLERQLRGVCPIVIANADYTLSQDEAEFGIFDVSGAQSAVRRLIFPAETDQSGRVVWISNVTTGGFGLSIVTNDGSVIIPATTTCAIRIRANGPARMT